MLHQLLCGCHYSNTLAVFQPLECETFVYHLLCASTKLSICLPLPLLHTHAQLPLRWSESCMAVSWWWEVALPFKVWPQCCRPDCMPTCPPSSKSHRKPLKCLQTLGLAFCRRLYDVQYVQCSSCVDVNTHTHARMHAHTHTHTHIHTHTTYTQTHTHNMHMHTPDYLLWNAATGLCAGHGSNSCGVEGSGCPELSWCHAWDVDRSRWVESAGCEIIEGEGILLLVATGHY